jgi:hypothetical protein
MAPVFTAIGAASAFAGSGAGAGLLTAATGASGPAGISRAFSVGSALTSIGAGIRARQQKRAEAAMEKAQALQIEAAGEVESLGIAREYAQLRGEQQAVQAAYGLQLGVGSADTIQQATQSIADRNIATTRANALRGANAQRLRAQGLLAEGNAAMWGGVSGAARAMLSSYQQTTGV